MKNKRVRQGQTYYTLNYYPPHYTESGVWLLLVERVSVTSTNIYVSDSTNKPFRNLQVKYSGTGYYLWRESGFLKVAYKSKNNCAKKAKRLVSIINWMQDNGASVEEIRLWLGSVLQNKEK